MDARGSTLTVRADRVHAQRAHGILPAPTGDIDVYDFSAVGLEQLELGKTVPVVDVRDPFAVG